MRLENWQRNALGREVPTRLDDRDYRPFAGSSAAMPEPATHPARVPSRPFDGASKVTTLEAAFEVVRDGDAVSFPHYYRNGGDRFLRAVVAELKRRGRKGIRMIGNAYFGELDYLVEALKDGTVAYVYGNPYGGLAKAAAAGSLLPVRIVGCSHGGRQRDIMLGVEPVRLAVFPAPAADIWGNASGILGKREELCGPLGLFDADVRYADYSCVCAGTVFDRFLPHRSLSMEHVDFVVPFPGVGDAAGIGAGTLDLGRIMSGGNLKVADRVMALLGAAGLLRDGVAFQSGSGASLAILQRLSDHFAEHDLKASFTIGGITQIHVEMLRRGAVELILHGQCFQPTEEVFDSLRNDPGHQEVSTSIYANLACKGTLTPLLDFSLLSCAEIDTAFNVNTVTGYDGRFVGGIGGGPNVGRSKLTIIFTTLAGFSKRRGQSYPSIRERVNTVTMPGELVDLVITEEDAVINPGSRSPALDALRANAAGAGIPLISMEALAAKAMAKAKELGPLMPEPELAGEPVEIVKADHGSILDVVRRPAATA
ncbi:MAG TPA: citrate lyase subunit alpha [Thermoanaerobaculaceae bacterium]|nr:citrate lyase subunit alpha [Thermoanaerobaculaceae bacterium]